MWVLHLWIGSTKKNKSVESKQSLLSQIATYASQPPLTSSHKCAGGKVNVFELMRLNSEAGSRLI